MTKQVVIVGAGHNGLVCACYLAKAGFDVTMFEKRDVAGGAAVTAEFHPGFRNSVASYTVSLLHPEIIADLKLADHGLRILSRPINNFLPLPDGNSLTSYPGATRMHQEVSRFSPGDADRREVFFAELDRLIVLFKRLMLMTPPAVDGGGLADIFKYLSIGNDFRKLAVEDKRSLLRLFSVSAGELLDDTFETDALKALIGFDSIVGNFASPYQAGSAYVLLHHLLGEVNGQPGNWGHAIGGMGAITAAMAAEANARGVEIHLDHGVQSISVKDGRATEVVLDNGERVSADIVVSNLNPRLLYLNLLSPEDISHSTIRHFKQYKCASGSFRMNVALDALPAFTADTPEGALTGGIILAPDLGYMDRAYRDAVAHGYSKEPVIEMLIPSLLDDSLAPAGRHVASLFCQQFDPGLSANWQSHRQAAAETIINTVNRYAPNFKESIAGMQILSPFDLETEFGLIGGDIFHGRLSLDQLFSARPMLGSGQYQTEVSNLFLCGSGTHPGGGVSGIPGRNAAVEIIRRS